MVTMANKRTHNNTATEYEERFEVLTHSTLTDEPEKPKNMKIEIAPHIAGSCLPMIVSVASTSTCDILSSDSILPSSSRDIACYIVNNCIKSEVSTKELPQNIDLKKTVIKDEIEEPYKIEDTDDLGYHFRVCDNAKTDVSKEQNIVKGVEARIEIPDHTRSGDSGGVRNETSLVQYWSERKKYLVPIPSTPIEIFRLLINDELLNIIVHETNKNGDRRIGWKPTNNAEILIFIGLLLHTGTIAMYNLADYWRDHYLYDIRVFERFMSRFRFMQILDFFRFCDEPDGEKIEAIHPLINEFNGVMKRTYSPGQNLIIDKIATFYCGNLVTNNLKNLSVIPSQVHSIHALAESESGIVWKLAAFNGWFDTNQVVKNLLQNNLNQGHIVYLTEYYMNFDIAQQLLLKGTYSTGPISTQLKDAMFHKYMKNQSEEVICGSLRKKGLNVYKCNNDYFLSTEKKQEVSPIAPWRSNAIVKPKPVIRYEQAMHTDYSSTSMTYYPCRDITLNWTMKVFIHVLQMALLNSYKLSSFTEYVPFRHSLLKSLLPREGMSNEEQHVLTKITKRSTQRTNTGAITTSSQIQRKVCRSCADYISYECLQCPGAPGFCHACFERVHAHMDYMMDG